MARLNWSAVGGRFYEGGVDRGVLYVGNNPGVPWNGLTSVSESVVGVEAKPYYLDGIKYLNLSSSGEFEATITAFTYPVEFDQCNGTIRVRPGLFFGQQNRKSFGLSYRTMIGNDSSGSNHAYKIHLVYDALASPSSRTSSTHNESEEISDFSWDLTTKPRVVPGHSPLAHVFVDSRYTHPVTMATIEDILYGSDLNEARLIFPEELIAIFDTPIEFEVTDNEDGTFLFAGPDSNVYSVGSGMFVLDHPDITQVEEGIYSINY